MKEKLVICIVASSSTMAAAEESDDDIFDADDSGTLVYSKEVEEAIAEVIFAMRNSERKC